jgi:ribosomal protein L4
MIDLFIVLEHSVQFNKCSVAASLEKAPNKTEQMVEKFKKLEAWEKEGKIKVVDEFAKLSFKELYIVDDKIRPEIRPIQLVTCHEINLFNVLTDLHPEVFAENGYFIGEDD